MKSLPRSRALSGPSLWRACGGTRELSMIKPIALLPSSSSLRQNISRCSDERCFHSSCKLSLRKRRRADPLSSSPDPSSSAQAEQQTLSKATRSEWGSPTNGAEGSVGGRNAAETSKTKSMSAFLSEVGYVKLRERRDGGGRGRRQEEVWRSDEDVDGFMQRFIEKGSLRDAAAVQSSSRELSAGQLSESRKVNDRQKGTSGGRWQKTNANNTTNNDNNNNNNNNNNTNERAPASGSSEDRERHAARNRAYGSMKGESEHDGEVEPVSSDERRAPSSAESSEHLLGLVEQLEAEGDTEFADWMRTLLKDARESSEQTAGGSGRLRRSNKDSWEKAIAAYLSPSHLREDGEAGLELMEVTLSDEDEDEDEDGNKAAEGPLQTLLALSNPSWRSQQSLPKDLSTRMQAILKNYNRNFIESGRRKLEELRNRQKERSKMEPEYTLGKRGGKIRRNFTPLPFTYGPKETIAYLASDMTPSYFVSRRVLRDVAKRLPQFEPSSLLDFGSGPGSVSWSARDLWPSSLREFWQVEPSQSMVEVAEELLEDFPNLTFRYSARELAPDWKAGKTMDLVVASEVLSELPDEQARDIATSLLWKMTAPGGVLVLIERGDAAGFEVVKEARDLVLSSSKLVSSAPSSSSSSAAAASASSPSSVTKDTSDEEAHVVAPCAHSFECPMRGREVCRFSQRVPCSVISKRKGFFDATLSYVALRKGPSYMSEVNEGRALLATAKVEQQDREIEEKREQGGQEKVDRHIAGNESEHLETIGDPSAPRHLWSRLVRPPLPKKKHVILDMCTKEGKIERVVVSKTKAKKVSPLLYRAARKSALGGLWPPKA